MVPDIEIDHIDPAVVAAGICVRFANPVVYEIFASLYEDGIVDPK